MQLQNLLNFVCSVGNWPVGPFRLNIYWVVRSEFHSQTCDSLSFFSSASFLSSLVSGQFSSHSPFDHPLVTSRPQGRCKWMAQTELKTDITLCSVFSMPNLLSLPNDGQNHPKKKG
jgi:hypothetical protein